MANGFGNSGGQQQRGGYGGRPAATPPPQRTSTDLAQVTGSFRDAQSIADAIERAGKHFNLVGSTTISNPPVGCELALVAVKLNPDPKGGDVYDVGFGKLAPSRAAIDRLANAARVQVIESTCLRGEQRHVEWRVVVSMRTIDGSTVQQMATRVIDLREGSQYLESLRAKARSNNKDPDSQANEILKMLHAHAETKARLRATRALLGVKTYTAEELQRPFIVTASIFTGQSEDPVLRHAFAAAIAQNYLGGQAALYGNAPRPVFGPAQPIGGFLAPGPSYPSSQQQGYGGGYGTPAGVPDAEFDEPEDLGGGAPAAPSAATQPRPVAGGGGVAPGDPTKFYMPGRKGETAPIVDAADKDLAYWSGRIQKGLDEGTSKYPDRDGTLLATIRLEQSRRTGGPPPGDQPPADPAGGYGGGDMDPEDYDR